MQRVIIESPFAGRVRKNIRYARRCMLDSLQLGEAPYLSHLLYPQVLDDTNPEQRSLGIKAGLTWGDVADITAVYQDYGISLGMTIGINDAVIMGRKIEYRDIGKNEFWLRNRVRVLKELLNEVSHRYD